MLTPEQRHLLGGIGVRPLTNVILEFEPGLSAIKASCAGGHLRRHDGAPEWLTTFDTTSKGYVGREQFGGDVRVTVTWTQLRNFAADVPRELKDQLRAARSASQLEQQRVYKWCHCHHGDLERAAACEASNKGDPHYGDRTHPSDDEDEAHMALDRELHAQEKDLVLRALGLVGEPVGQLDMFAELMGAME